jgi:hypothetical protein
MIAMTNTKGGGRILVGVSEIAESQGITGHAVSQWIKRYSDFPEPVVRLRMGPVFYQDEVYEWITRKWDI